MLLELILLRGEITKIFISFPSIDPNTFKADSSILLASVIKKGDHPSLCHWKDSFTLKSFVAEDQDEKLEIIDDLSMVLSTDLDRFNLPLEYAEALWQQGNDQEFRSLLPAGHLRAIS